MHLWKTMALVVPLGVAGGLLLAKGLDPEMLDNVGPAAQSGGRPEASSAPIRNDPIPYENASLTGSGAMSYRPDLDYDAVYTGPDVSTLEPPEFTYAADFPSQRSAAQTRDADRFGGPAIPRVIDAADRAEAAARDVMEAGDAATTPRTFNPG